MVDEPSQELDMIFHSPARLPGSPELVAVFGMAAGPSVYSLSYLRHPNNFNDVSLATHREITAAIHAIQSVRHEMAGHDTLPKFDEALTGAQAKYETVKQHLAGPRAP